MPRHLEAVPTSPDSVQLVWDAPSLEGGAPITNYVIEKRDSHHRSVWSGAGTTERTTFTAGESPINPPAYRSLVPQNAHCFTPDGKFYSHVSLFR